MPKRVQIGGGRTASIPTAAESFDAQKAEEMNSLSFMNDRLMISCDIVTAMTALSDSAIRLTNAADRASLEARKDIPKPFKDDDFYDQAWDVIADMAVEIKGTLTRHCGCDKVG